MDPKLAAAYAAIPPPDSDHAAFRVAVARGLMCGYHARWCGDEDWTVGAVEKEFRVPIVNPHTSRPYRHFSHAGKFDGLVSRDGDAYLLEHKSCAEDITAGGPYWRRLALDTQISGYLLASWLLGQKLRGVLYDVIRKPEIRPKKLGLKETVEIRSTGQYFDRPLSSLSYHAFALDPEHRETPEMFEARLAQDTVARPAWYFGRQIITRLDKEILLYAEELWHTAREIRRSLTEDDRRRNDKACFAYHRPCEYLDLCAGHARPENGRFRSLPTIHPELEDLDHDGTKLLTHTRLATFITCRRKHHYRYVLGISAFEESEPLAFGRLLHAALAAWWETPSDA